jgi:ergothioneine biosynthesis protein EgtB
VRTQRGNLSRPTDQEIYEYRAYVDDYLQRLLESSLVNDRVEYLIQIGINHEQQHQELLYYDIKYILGHNPLLPAYSSSGHFPNTSKKSKWLDVPAGLHWIGYDGHDFCYDNEWGHHQTYTQAFCIRNSLITNEEYLEFIEDGGYADVSLWHSEGWTWIQENKITAPLYWHNINGVWHNYTLNGLVTMNMNRPVQHISYFEGAAFMAWKNWRLPTEQEWEVAADHIDWGALWEWTESAYLPYPGYEKEEGALGEYNGKFMVNQKVLRGASFVTSKGHSRKTYRNFFHPEDRWQFAGIRPVKD